MYGFRLLASFVRFKITVFACQHQSKKLIEAGSASSLKGSVVDPQTTYDVKEISQPKPL